MSYQIVQTAKLRPGKCIFSGEVTGPFLDTGKNIPRYGRVYISIKNLKLPIRDLGYRSQDEVADLVDDHARLLAEVTRLSAIEEKYLKLIELIEPHLPKPEPIIQEKIIREVRTPTDEEIEEWIRTYGGTHPAVLRAKRVEKGSTEEWELLYGAKAKKPIAEKLQDKEPLETEAEVEDAQVQEEASREYLLMGQVINLDEVLSLNVQGVLDYCEGKDEAFIAALVRREWVKSEASGTRIRKGILEPLGYWDDEDDEPLWPEDAPEPTEVESEEE